MIAPTITYHQFHGEQDILRNPRQATTPERSKRALILTALTLFIPGGAQIAAGSRSLGRAALAVTIGCWFTLLLGVTMYFTMRGTLLTALTQPFVLWAGAIILALLAIGWQVLWLDTFRLIRFGQLAPGFKPIIAILLILLTVLTSGGLGYLAHLLNEGRQGLGAIFSQGPAMDADEGRYNFLLLGADADEGRDGLRPDSIHVVSVNQDTAETIIISVPRNFQNAQFTEDSPLWEQYPDGFSCGNDCIINFLYTEVNNNYPDLYPEASDPGVEAMKDAIGGSLDLNIHGYVMVDMGGFSQLIDAMGGITVDSEGWVPHRGPHPETGQWGDRWFEPGTLDLDGDDALYYARSRDYSSDYNRVQRQQCVQQAMIGQFSPQTLLTRFTDIMTAGENIVETDIPQNQLGSLLDLAADAQEHTPQRLTLGSPDFDTPGNVGELYPSTAGQELPSNLFSTYPDFDEIHARVDELIADEEGGSGSDDDDAEDSGDTENGDSGDGAEGSQDEAEAEDEAGPTEEQTDEAVADDEPQSEETAAPDQLTQPDGSPLTEDYLIEVQSQNPESEILYQAASNNGECSPGG